MSKSLISSVAFSIRHFRKEKNLSQEDLAERAYLDRTYISGVERGVRNITLVSLEQIIKALDITNAEFFNFAMQADTNELHHQQSGQHQI
jgi:transcriptional regulator with XRE-family HTH domain